jgi:hypothetical protein
MSHQTLSNPNEIQTAYLPNMWNVKEGAGLKTSADTDWVDASGTDSLHKRVQTYVTTRHT